MLFGGGRGDRHFVDNFVKIAGYLDSLGENSLHFHVGSDRSFKGDHAVLRDDFDVVGVHGERFVGHERTPDLGSEFPIGGVHLLLVGGGLAALLVALVDARVIRFGLGFIRLCLEADGTRGQEER